MAKKFQRRVENFPCQHCGALVVGNGYTNHCPRCLWSKHVDTYPGDRAASCGGMMEPVLLEGPSPNYRILHKCTICGAERVNKVQAEDSTEALLNLANNPHAPLGKSFNVVTGEEFDPLKVERSYENPDADIGDMESNLRKKR
ncbi:RNHCP domain-containing protein [Candidatus Parcubacteria bacterium]|nr:MAG: RNHCP domain-containing protein [Candidatus Parcubacteria bacterium]